MDESIVALAIEALERRKEAIQAEIDALRGAKKAGPNQPKRSAAARKAQGERMRAYWTKKKRTTKAAKPAKSATRKKPEPQSAASKKAISERMKAYWAKRKASEAKSSQQAMVAQHRKRYDRNSVHALVSWSPIPRTDPR